MLNFKFFLPLTFLFLFLLSYQANSSFASRKSLQLPQSTILMAAQCGYDTETVIIMNNGTIAMWDKHLFNSTSDLYHIACFKSSQEIDEKHRYVALYSDLPKLINSYPNLLYRNKGNNLQPIYWGPFNDTDILMSIKISASVMGIALRTASSYQLRLYDITNFTQIYSKLIEQTDIYFIDGFGNLLIYDPLTYVLTVYYGQNYASSQIVQLNSTLNYQFVKVQDIGTYSTSKGITSKYVFIYQVDGQHYAQKFVQIQYQKGNNKQGLKVSQKSSQQVKDSLNIWVSNFTFFDISSLAFKVYCDDRVFEIDAQSYCVKEDGSCIIKSFPQNMLCVREHSSSMNYWNRVKFILDFNGNGKQTLEIYEEVKTAGTVLIVLLSLLLLFIIVMGIYVYLRKTRKITFKEFITFKWRRNNRIIVTEGVSYQKMRNSP